jgi:uncharacterized protein
MSGALVIFVKTPGFSPVKTRLARHLGVTQAEAFHLASTRAVASIAQCLGQQTDVVSYFAVAEQEALNNKNWQALPTLWQGEGGLGQRMALVYQQLLRRHDFVIIVGSDIPQMTVAELYAAATWLVDKQQSRLVYGASADGGFWLCGGNCAIPEPLWTNVRYSVADTGAQFLKGIIPLGEVQMQSTLCDVDELEDLIELRKSLVEMNHLSSAQEEIQHFLNSLPDPTVSN